MPDKEKSSKTPGKEQPAMPGPIPDEFRAPLPDGYRISEIKPGLGHLGSDREYAAPRDRGRIGEQEITTEVTLATYTPGQYRGGHADVSGPDIPKRAWIGIAPLDLLANMPTDRATTLDELPQYTPHHDLAGNWLREPMTAANLVKRQDRDGREAYIPTPESRTAKYQIHESPPMLNINAEAPFLGPVGHDSARSDLMRMHFKGHEVSPSAGSSFIEPTWGTGTSHLIFSEPTGKKAYMSPEKLADYLDSVAQKGEFGSIRLFTTLPNETHQPTLDDRTLMPRDYTEKPPQPHDTNPPQQPDQDQEE